MPIKRNGLLGVLLLLLLAACQKKVIPLAQKVEIQSIPKVIESPKIKRISLHLKSIKANDLQENLSLYDELLVNYSISVIEGDHIIQTYSSFKKLGNIRQNQIILLDSLQLSPIELKKNQKVGIQISLWEMDNYDQITKAFNQLNTVGGILQVPIALAEWSSVSNPLGWFLWGTRAGGLGMYFLSKFDQNDLLGVSEIIWSYEEIPKGKVDRFKKGNWIGGKKGIDRYDYQFTYQIKSLMDQ
jgi:hypothetical protein